MPLKRRVPKRGFHNRSGRIRVVNLDSLAERFDAGTVVNPGFARESAIDFCVGRARQKYWGAGDITKWA